MWETNHALTPRPKCGVSLGLQSDASILGECRRLHLEALTFPSKKKITQRPVHSSSFQNYFSDLSQGVWAHPTLQGYGTIWDHSSPSLKGLQLTISLHFKPNIVGYPEVKMQQAPPAVGFPQLTADLLRQREKQAPWWSSRCPHPGTTVRSSTYGTQEVLKSTSVPHHHPPKQERS